MEAENSIEQDERETLEWIDRHGIDMSLYSTHTISARLRSGLGIQTEGFDDIIVPSIAISFKGGCSAIRDKDAPWKVWELEFPVEIEAARWEHIILLQLKDYVQFGNYGSIAFHHKIDPLRKEALKQLLQQRLRELGKEVDNWDWEMTWHNSLDVGI